MALLSKKHIKKITKKQQQIKIGAMRDNIEDIRTLKKISKKLA